MSSTNKITDTQLFSARLKELRGDRKKAAFARELGVSAQVYQRYEAGRIPQAGILSVIAGRCKVTADWLLGRTDDRRAVYLNGAGEAHVLREERGSYGTTPEYHVVKWHPQWNPRTGDMARDEICDLIEGHVPRLRTKKAGDPLARACHYLMDLLNELANRKEPTGGEE